MFYEEEFDNGRGEPDCNAPCQRLYEDAVDEQKAIHSVLAQIQDLARSLLDNIDISIVPRHEIESFVDTMNSVLADEGYPLARHAEKQEEENDEDETPYGTWGGRETPTLR